jgi:coenzyme F420-reducing hydrogenase gamma subunit
MKPRIGFFDFTGCEGCQLTILNLGEQLLDLLDLVDIVEFREVQNNCSGPLDIAFVEGSICRQDEIDRLRLIRERSKTLVVLGACADLAGINALHGEVDPGKLVTEIYGSASAHLQVGPTRSVKEVVQVDHRIPGCPIDGREFLSVLQALLLDRSPELPGFAVCVECKLAELPCTFEQGIVCLGPVSRAGCNALCIAGGDRCRGCRGLVDNPRDGSYQRVLQEYDRTVDDILEEFRTYNLRTRKEP